MFRNYLMTAIRNLFRNKLYAFINIGGLAVGLAACILIVLFVVEEKTHDNFWDNKENLYRLEGIVSLKGREPRHSPSFPAPAKQPMLAEFPEIIDILRFTNGIIPVRIGDTRYSETILFTDPNLFEMLSFEFVEGSKETAFNGPRNVVMSETMARKYFGDEPALGRTLHISISGEVTFKVGGVVKDLPTNTHVDFQMAVPIVLSDFDNPDGSTNALEYWGSFSVYTFVELIPEADVAGVQARMPDFLDRHVPDTIRNIVNMSGSELFQTRFINITDMHLEGTPRGAMKPRGDNATIAAFIVIAILILVIAGINFMNLATVQSMKRSKEVAVRKAVGAKRSNITSQFLGETIGLCFLALMLAILLVQIALPWYNEVSSKFLEMRLFSDPTSLMALAAFTIVVGLGAGAYPALMLASFRPSEIFQGGSGHSGGSTWLRKILVITQFSISIGLIIATAVILAQIRFAKTMDMGFDKENMLVIRAGSQADYPALSPALIEDLKRLPEVIDATRSTGVPGDTGFSSTAVRVAGQDELDPTPIGRFAVDYGFFETYGIAPITGRTFSENYGTDLWVRFGEQDRSPNSSVILNEAGMRRLGFETPEQAVGQVILSGQEDVSNLVIVGVVPDFNFQSARVDVRPEMYFIDQGDLFPISVRFQTDNPGAFLAAVEQIWYQHFPDEVFTTEFVDQNLAAQYQQDEARGYLIGAFSLLAIFVSSLGLFGLAALTTERRTKEIGVRKVMGASVFKIVRLITWQFSKPVVIANAIAWPVAWFFMARWLDGFVYRIDLSILFFVFAGLVAISIAWATVASHAWAVARTTPVKALRYE